jgi:cell division protein FtsW
MTAFARTDPSILGRWWWTVDRWTIAAVALLVAFGALLIMAASPPVAERLGLDPFYFARRHFTVLPVAMLALFAAALLSPRGLRRCATCIFAVALLAVVATLLIGVENKGATRWIALGGLSLQPSEFLKPSFAVVTAWMLAAHRREAGFPGNSIAIGLLFLVVALLALQPDIGMAVVITAVWGLQFFVAGLRAKWVALCATIGGAALAVSYLYLPHVTSRIDRFLDPSVGDSYQVTTSLEAFLNGGLLGRGPGEGTVKAVLPDAHADFVFAVVGEEFGLIVALAVVGVFAFIVLRGIARLMQETDLFILLAGTGLLAQFGLQAVINMGSTLRLLPTKGMTLPFLSYGGSSMLAVAIGIGMLLALTRRRVPGEAV